MTNPISKKKSRRKIKIRKFKPLLICFFISVFCPLFLSNSATSVFKEDITEVFSHFGYIKLIANSETNASSTDFYFNSNATAGLDPGYDTSLFGGFIPEFSLYSHLVENNIGTPFSIQTLGENDMNDITIPLGLHAIQGQQIVLKILESDLPDSISIYLEDSINGTSTLLNEEQYSFNTDSDLSGTGRFYIRFDGDALGTNEPTLANIDIYANASNKTIVVEGPLISKTTLKLYDTGGKLIKMQSLDITNNKQAIDSNNLNSGVFIVELTNALHQRRVQKLIID